MATDLFVFSLKPLMILESETRKRRGRGHKQSKGDRRDEGVGFT